MPFANYIFEYYSRISSGEITVGKWVLLLYEIIINGLQKGEYLFNAQTRLSSSLKTSVIIAKAEKIC